MIMRRVAVSALACASVSLIALAAEAQCYRHEECSDDQLCIELSCADPEEPLDACDTVDECPSFHFLCDDGYCKKDGVYCQNPAGHCNVDNGWSSCGCEDGLGSDGMGGEQDPPPTDEELYAECLDILVGICGEEAPDINDECTPEQLETCEEYYEWLNQLLVECDQEPEEVDFVHLKFCCRDLEEENQEFLDQLECVMALVLEDCADLPDCWDDDGEAGGSDSDSDVDSDADSDADKDADAPSATKDSGGCGVAPGVASHSLLAGIIALLV